MVTKEFDVNKHLDTELSVLRQIRDSIQHVETRQDEAFTDMYRELREIKIRLTEVSK